MTIVEDGGAARRADGVAGAVGLPSGHSVAKDGQ